LKLVIQIPCLNEEDTLPATLRDLPKSIPGVDEIQILIVDDGSTDRTVEIAREMGADRIVRLHENKGLAAAFAAGLETSLKMGADVIVHTDADNQYKASGIPALIDPIVNGDADIVIGARPIETIAHFSRVKKVLQWLGSWVVRRLSGTMVADATSGFRAYSQEAALKLTVVSDFSYTLETIIEAGHRRLTVMQVPIETNPQLRESRLFSSMPSYVWKSLLTILRTYAMYRPLHSFLFLSVLMFIPGFAFLVRFFYFYFSRPGPTGHMQSLIVAAILLILSVVFFTLGVLGDIIASNRKLMEESLYRLRKSQLAETPDARDAHRN